MAVQIPNQTIRFTAPTEGRAQYVYGPDGTRTSQPKTNAAGEPLTAFTAVCEYAGEVYHNVRVLAPTEPPKAPFGTIYIAEHAVLTIGNNRDAFDVRISVETPQIKLERGQEKAA